MLGHTPSPLNAVPLAVHVHAYLLRAAALTCSLRCVRTVCDHSGVLNIVLLLLEAGARVDEKNTAGSTPLHKAANNGHVGHSCCRQNGSVGELVMTLWFFLLCLHV